MAFSDFTDLNAALPLAEPALRAAGVSFFGSRAGGGARNAGQIICMAFGAPQAAVFLEDLFLEQQAVADPVFAAQFESSETLKPYRNVLQFLLKRNLRAYSTTNLLNNYLNN